MNALFGNALVEKLAVILLLTLADAGFGAALALRNGQFDLGKLADFMRKNTLAYALAYLVVHFIMVIGAPMAEWFGETAYMVDGRLADFLWVVLIASLSKQLLDKIGTLAGAFKP